MQATHDTAADILQSQGINPCAVYREKQVEYILNHVESGHKKCKVCNKELSSTQKLKSHIRATVMDFKTKKERKNKMNYIRVAVGIELATYELGV